MAVMAAAAIVATSSFQAVADNLVADGDDLTPVASNAMSLGTVCVGKAVSKSALLAVSRNGNTNNVFKAGATVTVTVTGVTGAGLRAVMDPTPATITLPANWADAGNNALSEAVSSRVTLQAGQSAGSFSGSVAYSATGTEATGAGLTRTTIMPVTATVSGTGACAPSTNNAPKVSISGPENGKSYEFGAVPTATCSWTDDQDGSGTANPSLTGPVGPRADAGLGAVTVTCSKTDSGTPPLTGTASLTYTVVDTTAPSIPPLSDVAAAAVDADGARVTYTVPPATDAVDGTVPLTCSPAPGSRFPLGSTTVTCTVTDLEGNAGVGTFTVGVTDQDAPVVSVPDSMTVAATSPSGAVATFTVGAKDNVDGALAPRCTPASGTTFPFGTTIVSCEATDAAGNTGGGSFSVTVQDATDPVLTTPSPDPVEATGPEGATVSWDAVTATDDVDGTIPASCDAQPGDVFPLGDTTVTCTAEDSHGNTGSGSFVVTVQDTTGPDISVPQDFVVEATSSTGAVVHFADQVSATDLVDGQVKVDCSPQSGSPFGFGATMVTCTSEDSRGNAAAPATFTVTVADTTPPALPTLTDLDAVEATGPDGAAVSYAVGTAKDIVDGDVNLDCTPASGSTFSLGRTSVTCTATDRAGNSAEGSFSVRVVDTTAPVVESLSSMTLEATSSAGAVYDYRTPTATDTVDGTVLATCMPASGSTFPLGDTKVVCSAEDHSGNTGTGAFLVTVKDTTAPSIGAVSDITVAATSSSGSTVTYAAPTADDLVDGAVPVTCDHPSGSTFPLGTTTVTCSASDAAGNSTAKSFTVTVEVSWSGFLAPLDRDGTRTFKQGSTIPVKFVLSGVSAGITALDARLYARRVGTQPPAGEVAATSTSQATTGNLFRYSPSDRQYIFDLATKGLAPGTYELRVDLGDGVSRTVTVTLR